MHIYDYRNQGRILHVLYNNNPPHGCSRGVQCGVVAGVLCYHPLLLFDHPLLFFDVLLIDRRLLSVILFHITISLSLYILHLLQQLTTPLRGAQPAKVLPQTVVRASFHFHDLKNGVAILIHVCLSSEEYRRGLSIFGDAFVVEVEKGAFPTFTVYVDK